MTWDEWYWALEEALIHLVLMLVDMCEEQWIVLGIDLEVFEAFPQWEGGCVRWQLEFEHFQVLQKLSHW